MSHYSPISEQQEDRLLALIPDADGITTADVFDAAAAAGLPVYADPAKGLRIGDDYPFESVLRLLRKEGWVVYMKYLDPPKHVRTPTGTTHLATMAQEAPA